jgi:hypothetical protein
MRPGYHADCEASRWPSGHQHTTGKESTDMSADLQPMLRANDMGVVPSVLVVLMAILALLGAVAHAAVL